MDLFRIDPKGSTEHDLKRIDKQYIPRILEAIENLAENPFPVQSKKLKDSESSYRLRVGDYRVIYQVDQEKRIRQLLFIIYVIERTLIKGKMKG